MKTLRCCIIALCCLVFGLEVSAQKIKRPESYNYQRGYEAMQVENYDEALEYLNRDLAENPKNGYSYLWIAVIRATNNDFGPALTAVDMAIKHLPKKDKEYVCYAYRARALVNLELEDTVKALKDLATAISINPDESLNYKTRAQVYYEQKQFDLSDADYRKLIDLKSGDVNGYMGLGRNCNERKQWAEAIKQFDYVTKLSNEYSSGYSFRAESYMGLEKWDEATDDIVKALNCEFDQKALYLASTLKEPALTLLITKLKVQSAKLPNEMLWPFVLGSLYENNHQYDKAIEYFNAANAIDTNDALYLRISRCYQSKCNYGQALSAINQALNMDSTDADYITQKAEIYYDLGDYPSAIAQCDKLIEMMPDSYHAYYRRAWIKTHSGDDEGAIEDFTTSIVLSPKNTYSYVARGDIYRRQGKNELADADFRKIIEIENAPDKYECVHYAYQSLGMEDKALSACETIIARDTTDEGSYYDAACLYSRMKNHDKAIENLRKSLELGYNSFPHIDRDYDMDFLRDSEDFKALIKQYRPVTESGGETAFGQRDNMELSVQGNANATTTEVPFFKENGVCKVKCQINGLPLYFVFDTGASDVTISMVEATFMMKNGYLTDADVMGSQRYMDANGNVSVGTVINLKTVDFGGLTLNNVRASVVLNQKAPLLLGQSVLGRLGKIEIDNPRQLLKITHQ